MAGRRCGTVPQDYRGRELVCDVNGPDSGSGSEVEDALGVGSDRGAV